MHEVPKELSAALRLPVFVVNGSHEDAKNRSSTKEEEGQEKLSAPSRLPVFVVKEKT